VARGSVFLRKCRWDQQVLKCDTLLLWINPGFWRHIAHFGSLARMVGLGVSHGDGGPGVCAGDIGPKVGVGGAVGTSCSPIVRARRCFEKLQ
jgi:hypothetical protein